MANVQKMGWLGEWSERERRIATPGSVVYRNTESGVWGYECCLLLREINELGRAREIARDFVTLLRFASRGSEISTGEEGELRFFCKITDSGSRQ
jgi:hypothetical protein